MAASAAGAPPPLNGSSAERRRAPERGRGRGSVYCAGMQRSLAIDGTSLTLEGFGDAVHGGVACALARTARQRVEQGRRVIERALAGGGVVSAEEGLRRAGLAPLELQAKEGLALINGTQAMTSLLALAALEARRLVKVADLGGALSADALRGSDCAFDPRIHALRPYRGQQASAANLWRLLQGAAIRESHRVGDVRV